jgi:KDO2-lipid IV(A) lauroyltransferase
MEASVVRLGFALFRALPLDTASSLGGWTARRIGPLLSISRGAERRLHRALPEIDAQEGRRVIADMWENLGRVVAETPHLGDFDIHAPGGRVTVIGGDNIRQLRDDGFGCIFFSAHFGNWELLPIIAGQSGIPLTYVYREANNPAVEAIFRKVRASLPGRSLPKGPAGARALITALAKGKHLAMLVDQKMNDGIAVRFFGRDAMTAPAIARLALRFHCPVVPARVERQGGAHFRVTIFPPLRLLESGDTKEDMLAAMIQINALLENWIRARPDHWLWLHRRWPD